MAQTVRILHVEDEPAFAELTKTYLERLNDQFIVDTATDAEEGLSGLTENDYDCIVSDYDMPGPNGIQFLEAVRDDHPDLPFILFTGKGSEEIASEAISAGVSDYLQKGGGSERYSLLANRITTHVEKQATHTKLRDREKRLNLFFEQSPLGVIRWDQNFEFARMNNQVEEILGYDATDLEGQSWEAIVPDSDRDAVREVVDDLLENKGGYHSINENVRKDGERIVCEWHNRVVTDANDEVVAIYSQFHDITERKERERDLLETNRRLELALQGSDAGIWEWDVATGELYWSDELLGILGYSQAEFPGTIAFLNENLHPDDAERTEEAIETAIETGEPYRVEQRVETRHHEYRWFDVRGQVIGDETNRRIVGIGFDITDRKRQEQELREYERRFTAIYNNPISYMALLRPDGTVLSVNEEALSFVGTTNEIVADRPFWDTPWWSHSEPLQEELRSWIDLASDGEVVRYEADHHAPDGDQVTIDGVIHPIRNQHGEVIELLAAGRDITKRQEREMELEERVKERSGINRVAELFVQHDDLTDIFERSAGIIKESFRYPESTDVKIAYGDLAASTTGYSDQEPMLLSTTRTNAGTELRLTAVNRTNQSEPFLEEKQSLLDIVLWLMRGHIERLEYEHEVES